MDLVKVAPKDLPTEHVLGLLRYSEFPDRVKAHANGANVLHFIPIEFATTASRSQWLPWHTKKVADQVGPMRELSENLEAGSQRTSAPHATFSYHVFVSGEVDVY